MRPSWTAGNHAGSRTGDESKGKAVKSFLKKAAVAACVVGGVAVANAQSSPTLPDVSTTMDTVKGLAYTAITIAVAIVGVKMGIKFVKWIRG